MLTTGENLLIKAALANKNKYQTYPVFQNNRGSFTIPVQEGFADVSVSHMYHSVILHMGFLCGMFFPVKKQTGRNAKIFWSLRPACLSVRNFFHDPASIRTFCTGL